MYILGSGLGKVAGIYINSGDRLPDIIYSTGNQDIVDSPELGYNLSHWLWMHAITFQIDTTIT